MHFISSSWTKTEKVQSRSSNKSGMKENRVLFVIYLNISETEVIKYHLLCLSLPLTRIQDHKCHTHAHTHLHIHALLEVAYIFSRRWRQMGKLPQRVQHGYFESRRDKQSPKHIKRKRRRMQRDKEAVSGTPWPHSAPCRAATEQHTFPLLVNGGGFGRHVCLFPINPFPNYRAEGKCRTASAQISPNEPPPFLSPASCLPTSSPVWSLFHTAPVSVSLVLFHASAN